MFLLSIALKSVVVLGAGWLVTLFMRRKSAAILHVIWSTAFAALLALPLFSISLPALRVPVAGPFPGSSFVYRADASASALAPGSEIRMQEALVHSNKSTSRTRNWPSWLLLVWAAGVVAGSIQMLAGWLAVRHLRSSAKPVAIADLDSLTRRLGMAEHVILFETSEGSMPITCGVRRPVIFLPPDVTEWSAERRRLVLLHELAHIRRGDIAIQLFSRIALILYWWNPLAWIAWCESLKQRERAADDVVLNAGASATQYASDLLEVARSLQSLPAAGYAAIAMARRSQLEGRLLAILDSNRDRRSVARVSLAVSFLLALGLMVPLAAVQAQNKAGQAPLSTAASMNSFASLLNNGDMALERLQFEEARTIYKKAQSVSGSASETASALLHLGTADLAAKNVAQAIDDFERAQSADSGKTAEAKMWMAIAQESQNNLEAADGLFQGALAAEDPHSEAAATTTELYAQLLLRENKPDEAKAMQAQATAVRKAQTSQLSSMNQPASPDVYRIGGDVHAPTVVAKVEPQYTQEARLAKYQGSTLLSVEIGADGLAHNIRVLRGLGLGLDKKAVEAVRRWNFKPATKDGQPVTVSAQVEVNFRLL